MNCEELRLFAHLAESLRFSRSAAECNISPSALSRTIQRMEDELSCTLFYRDKRHVELTPGGEIFARFARETLERFAETRELITRQAGDVRGDVSLFCSVTAAQSLLNRMLPPFRARYPEVNISIQTGDSADAVDRVLQGGADLSIVARPPHLADSLEFLELTRTPLVFIAPGSGPHDPSGGDDGAHEHRLRGDRSHRGPRITGLPDLPFILADRALSRDYATRWFREQGVVPEIYSEVAGHEAIIAMVQLGFGVGVVPRLVLEQSPLASGVHVVDVSPALPEYHVGLCARRRRLALPAVRAFWDVVADLVPHPSP